MTTDSVRARTDAGYGTGPRRPRKRETSARHREQRMADKVEAYEALDFDALRTLCDRIRAERGMPDDTFVALLHDMAAIDEQTPAITRLPGPADPDAAATYPAELLERIVADIDGGLGWSSVARALNEEGSRNSSGSPWIPARVMQLYQRAKSPRQKRRCQSCGVELPAARGRPRTRCQDCAEVPARTSPP